MPKKQKKYIVALSSHQATYKCRNQPKMCGHDGGEKGEKVCLRGSMGEEQFLRLGQSSWAGVKNWNKINEFTKKKKKNLG
jgi:hypothetical protein